MLYRLCDNCWGASASENTLDASERRFNIMPLFCSSSILYNIWEYKWCIEYIRVFRKLRCVFRIYIIYIPRILRVLFTLQAR